MAVPLWAYSLNGSYMRLSGDDYCYAAVVTQYGFFGAQWQSYTDLPPYNGNRYSMNLVSGIVSMLIPAVNGALPGLAIALWVVLLSLGISEGSSLASGKLRRAEILLLSCMLVFVTLYQAPDLAQVLYWRSGMLTYLAPVIANSLLVAVTLAFLRRAAVSIGSYLALAGLAFFAGGFSETGSALQASYQSLAFLWLLGAASLGRKDHSLTLRLVGSALMGTCMAMIALAISPQNAPRLSPAPELDTLLIASVRRAVNFIRGSFTGLPVPTAFTIAVATLLSIASGLRQQAPPKASARRLLLGSSVALITTSLLIASTMAPSEFARRTYPEPRALITARFAMVLGEAGIAWLVGQQAVRLIRGRRWKISVLQPVCAVLLATFWIYPPRAAQRILFDRERFSRWAALWDERDRNIRLAADQGQQRLEVMELDHPIPFVAELQPSPDSWYNDCAEIYYGVTEIRATLPGWNQ